MNTKDADIENWPQTWQGVEEDVPYGEGIVKNVIPFIEEMKSRNMSVKTINEHIDNLWMLGGYLIHQLHYYEEKRKFPSLDLIRESIGSDGGPLISDFTEYQQDRFDATCRKLHKYLKSAEKR
jgi:gamma-glutamyl-gamma-aminobutyrate hydrolase PuuD